MLEMLSVVPQMFVAPLQFNFNVRTYVAISGSWDSSVGIATGYGLDGPGLIPGSARFFSSPQCPD
jgi:hypothetical protein